jgi:hypothetical protein
MIKTKSVVHSDGGLAADEEGDGDGGGTTPRAGGQKTINHNSKP